ncbi:MAG: AraC family transcriptional regulator [Archangium sp.]
MRPQVLAFTPKQADALPLEVLSLDGKNVQFEREAHGHRFYELLYVTHGTGWHRVGLERANVGPGSLLLTAPGEVHDTRGLVGVRGWLLIFEAAAVRTSTTSVTELPSELAFLPFARGAGAPAAFVVPRAERDEWALRLRSLQRETTGGALGRTQLSRAELDVVLIKAARLVAPSLGLGAAHRPLLAEVFQFIDARYTRPISLRDVAKAVQRSPAHLTTVVRESTGRSVVQWIHERRMAEARRLLLETELEVGEIGERVGFPEPSYFVRRFRATHRVTPLGFRKPKESTIAQKGRAFRQKKR